MEHLDLAFTNLDDIAQLVDKYGGVQSLLMMDLRDAYGKKRLSSAIRSEISAALAERGIAHFPQELPNSQDDMVRLFNVTSQVGKLIQVVLTCGDSEDEQCRQLASSPRRMCDVAENKSNREETVSGQASSARWVLAYQRWASRRV
jgi:hypothetical protein